MTPKEKIIIIGILAVLIVIGIAATSIWFIPPEAKPLDYSEPPGPGGGMGYIQEPLSNNYTVVGGGGGAAAGFVPYSFNLTECNAESKKYGSDCSCMRCGVWISVYQSSMDKGFFNLTGYYYGDGTPTGKTGQQMEDEASMRSNLEYERYMNERGHYRVNGKWV